MKPIEHTKGKNMQIRARTRGGMSLLAPVRDWIILLMIAATSTQIPAYGHGGQIEVAGGVRGPVQLSATQQNAIALQLVTAGPHPLASVLALNGEVQLLPDRVADVSLRISGQVKAVYANLGDTVRTGQRLVQVQSRLVGDPPPSVTITAPRSGVIDARNVVVGQAVEPNTVLFHISDRSQVLVVAKVFEGDLGKIHVGQTARIRVPSYPGNAFAGKLTLIDPNLDPLNRTIKVWIQIDNPHSLLKPYMFARANIVLKRDASALTVPNAAIMEANGEKFVFVREGTTFKRIEITVGAKDDEYSEVTNGLVPGDEVVTQGGRQVYTMWLTGGKPQAEE
jgi:multidrug efflux pump subunit AcrA (membrane-fusion protein)